MTKEKERRFIVLLSIFEIGGEGTKKKVLDNISIKKYANFSKRDLQIKINRNELIWRNEFAYVRNHLVEEGYIDDSIKYCWKITEEGLMYLRTLKNEVDIYDYYQVITENALLKYGLLLGE